MFEISVQIQNRVDRVRRAEKDARRNSFNRTAFMIFQTARQSIERSEGASPKGKPPHTHKGNWIRRAIRYAADRAGAVIGTLFSVLGEAGKPHELGGMFKGASFPERPFMFPAMEANLDIFAGSWDGRIGE